MFELWPLVSNRRSFSFNWSIYVVAPVYITVLYIVYVYTHKLYITYAIYNKRPEIDTSGQFLPKPPHLAANKYITVPAIKI